jgi:MFS family permease
LDIRKLADAWQDPAWAGVFMVAYFVLSLVTGASISLGFGPGPFSLSGWVATAFLSWRVTDGGRISRMLLIVLSWASFIFAVVLVRTGLSVAEFCVLVASAAQIALLLSPAVYERTRREHGGRVPLWRTREPPWLAIAFAVGVVVGLAWVVVYATALSGHDKAGPFHGGPGTATAAFGIVFLISLAGLTLPLTR